MTLASTDLPAPPLLAPVLPAPALPAPAPPADDQPRPVEVPLTVEVVSTIDVQGPLDLSTIARVRARIEDALRTRPTRLVVDLSGCTFVDASALAMLLEAHRRMSRGGGVLTLRGASPRVERLLSLTGLRRVFDLA